MTRTRYQYVPLLADDLLAMGAWAEQVKLFAVLYPNGGTPDDAEHAVAYGFDAYWLARALSCDSPYYLDQRAALYAAYLAQRDVLQGDTLSVAYWAQWMVLYDTFRAQQLALDVDCLRACWPVWEERAA